MIGIAPVSGLGNASSPGSILTTAQNWLEGAGYQDVVCRTERVYYPTEAGSSSPGYYEQNVCSPRGHVGANDATLVATQSQNARGYGTGIDLAAERAYALRQGGGDDPRYIDTFGSASNIQVLRTLGSDGQLVEGSQATRPQGSVEYSRMFASAPVPQGAGSAPTTNGPNASSAPVAAPSSFFASFDELSALWVAGGAAVALLLLMRK